VPCADEQVPLVCELMGDAPACHCLERCGLKNDAETSELACTAFGLHAYSAIGRPAPG